MDACRNLTALGPLTPSALPVVVATTVSRRLRSPFPPARPDRESMPPAVRCAGCGGGSSRLPEPGRLTPASSARAPSTASPTPRPRSGRAASWRPCPAPGGRRSARPFYPARRRSAVRSSGTPPSPNPRLRARTSSTSTSSPRCPGMRAPGCRSMCGFTAVAGHRAARRAPGTTAPLSTATAWSRWSCPTAWDSTATAGWRTLTPPSIAGCWIRSQRWSGCGAISSFSGETRGT